MESHESILNSIKKMLGPTEDYTHFDMDIIIHINSVFMILNQLGVGPDKAYSISDASATWADFMPDDTMLQSIKSYMYLKAKMMFDPPSSSTIMESMKRQIDEFEWRLNVDADTSTTSGEEEKQDGG